jgi:lauroyl/myristoyl acyltransferase
MKWRQELGVLRDHFVVPWLCALLPWPLAWRALRRLSRRGGWIFAHAERSAEAAQPALADAAGPAFAERAQLVKLLDLCDAPRSLLLGRRHFRHWWRVDGAWPQQPAFVAVSLHYGNGLWPVRHLRWQGHPAHFIAQRIDPRWFDGQPATRAAVAFREACVERAMQRPIIHSGGARARCLSALRSGSSIVALLDNPQGLERGAVPVTLFGRRLALHTGILRVAIEAGMPVVPYLAMMGENGRRRLDIGPPLTGTDVAAMCATLAGWFGPRVAADPAGWHLWPNLGEFETAVAALHPPAADGATPPAGE